MTGLALGNGIVANPKAKYNVFQIGDKKYILENLKTIGCYQADKLGKDEFTAAVKKLQKAGCDITVGEPTFGMTDAIKNTKADRLERLRAIRNNPIKRARYNKLKLAQNPELKERYERMTKNKGWSGKLNNLLDKAKDFAKTKTGKWTLIGGGALILAAIVAKCVGGKKEPQETQQ